MVNIDKWGYEGRDPRGRKYATKPTDPEKIFKIVYLRETKNMSWAQVAHQMGMSRQGPYLLYKKWCGWAKENNQC
jgi:hypothetical protein